MARDLVVGGHGRRGGAAATYRPRWRRTSAPRLRGGRQPGGPYSAGTISPVGPTVIPSGGGLVGKSEMEAPAGTPPFGT